MNQLKTFAAATVLALSSLSLTACNDTDIAVAAIMRTKM